jgi:hypothetical protein
MSLDLTKKINRIVVDGSEVQIEGEKDRIDIGDFIGTVGGLWKMMLVGSNGDKVGVGRYLDFEKGNIDNVISEDGIVGLSGLSCRVITQSSGDKTIGNASFDMIKQDNQYIIGFYDGDTEWNNIFGQDYVLMYNAQTNILDESVPTGGDFGTIQFVKVQDILLQDVTVTENCVVTHDILNYDGLGKVTVDVASSGGADINGILKECVVAEGQNIESGDFVANTLASNVNSGRTPLSPQDTIQLSENKFFSVYGSGGIASNAWLAGELLSINGTSITKTSLSVNSTDKTGLMKPFILKLDDNRLFIAHSYGSSYYLYATVITIEGSSITSRTTTQISSSSQSFYTNIGVKGFVYDTNKVALFHPTGSSYFGTCTQLEIAEDGVVTVIATTSIHSNLYNNYFVGAYQTAPDTAIAFMTESKSSYEEIYVKQINLTDQTTSNLTSISGFDKNANTYRIDDDTILILTKLVSNSNVYGALYYISTNAFGERTQIGSGISVDSEIVSIGENKYIFASGKDYKTMNFVTVEVSSGIVVLDKIESYSTIKQISNNTPGKNTFVLTKNTQTNNLLLTYGYQGYNYSLYDYIFEYPVSSKITSGTQAISGIASENKGSGQKINVYVPNV